jgi:hypothetical protein
MRRLHTRGQYAPDGPEQRLRVRQEAGHRCIRCHHPFETGKHGKGEWTPCDKQCTHKGPVRIVRADGERIAIVSNATAADLLSHYFGIEAQWRILTVHHLDGDKANDAWWNTLALCQRCHLSIQCKVDPDIPFFFEHTEWMKPYIAGFYAWKYEHHMVTREEATTRMDELLAYEKRAA